MDSTPPFTGVGVALVTVFDDDRAVDVAATVTHAERLVDAGVRAVVIAGSTGEAPALSVDERTALVRAARDRLPADVPVVAGTGDVSPELAREQTRTLVDAGADAVLALSPLRAGDPRRYYAEVRRGAGTVPLLAYHFPAMSPPGIPVEVLTDLDVDGVKDSSGDPERLLREVEAFRGWVYVGAATLLVQAGAIGCAGAILALANVEPERCVAAFAGDGDAQRALLAAHLASSRDFPHGMKRTLAERYGLSPVTRMG